MGELHRRILPTFVCQPVLAEDAKLGVLPWTMELPPGWFLAESPPGGAVLSDGTRGLVVRASSDQSDRESLGERFAAGFAQEGMKVKLGAWEGDQVAMRGTTAEGGPLIGWIRLIECSAMRVMVMALDISEAGAAELATLMTTTGRCVKDGEVAPPWPEAPRETAPTQAGPG